MPVKQIDEERLRWYTEDFTGGINLFKAPYKLADNEFTLFENFLLFEQGKFLNAIKRKGFTRYNSNAPAGSTIIAVHEFVSVSGSFTRILIKTANSIEYCVTTGVFTTIATSQPTAKWKWLTFADKVFIIDRNNGSVWSTNKVYDGTNYLDMGYVPAKQIFVANAVMGTPAISGDYWYLVTYVYDDNAESYFIPKNYNSVYSTFASSGHTDVDSGENGVSTTVEFRNEFVFINPTSEMVKLYNLPISPSARCTGRRIYRTKSGGKDFYLVGEINDNTSREFVDTKLDSELTEKINIDYVKKPLIAKVHCLHKSRLFQANLIEDNIETAPAVDNIVITSGSGGNLTVSGDSRKNKYTYKFAHLVGVTLAQRDTTSVVRSKFVDGYVSLKSEFSQEATLSTDNKNSISGIANSNDWAGKVVVYRNTFQFISNAVQSGGDFNITVGDASVFKVGETVTIAGVGGTFVNSPNGSRVITAINTTTDVITIVFAAGGGTYTATTGTMAGGTFYYLGTTAVDDSGTYQDEFVDEILDTVLILGEKRLENNNVREITQSETFPSLLEWSLVNKTDIFINNIPVSEKDGEEITGIFSEDDGVVIFKENNVFKLYTNSDESLWELNDVLTGIGCSDRYAVCQYQNNNYVFLSNNTFYEWRVGVEARNCSKKIQTILDSLTFTNIDMLYNQHKNWIVITYSTSGVAGNVLVYDMNMRDENGDGSWYHWVRNSSDLSLRFPILTKAGIMLFGSGLSRIFQLSTSGNQDEVGGSFAGVNVKAKIRSKFFNDILLNVRRIYAKIKASGNGTADQVLFTPTVESVDQPNLTKTMAGEFTRLNNKCNFNAKEFYFTIENAENLAFEIQEIGMDYLPEHEAGGIY